VVPSLGRFFGFSVPVAGTVKRNGSDVAMIKESDLIPVGANIPVPSQVKWEDVETILG
jgi:hypothetical protein